MLSWFWVSAMSHRVRALKSKNADSVPRVLRGEMMDAPWQARCASKMSSQQSSLRADPGGEAPQRMPQLNTRNPLTR